VITRLSGETRCSTKAANFASITQSLSFHTARSIAGKGVNALDIFFPASWPWPEWARADAAHPRHAVQQLRRHRRGRWRDRRVARGARWGRISRRPTVSLTKIVYNVAVALQYGGNWGVGAALTEPGKGYGLGRLQFSTTPQSNRRAIYRANRPFSSYPSLKKKRGRPPRRPRRLVQQWPDTLSPTSATIKSLKRIVCRQGPNRGLSAELMGLLQFCHRPYRPASLA
jgi:hypothetical protein